MTCSQKIELGENLLSFKKNIEADSLVTAVIPLGKERMDGGEEGSGSRHNIGGWNASQSITDSKDIFQVTGKSRRNYNISELPVFTVSSRKIRLDRKSTDF